MPNHLARETSPYLLQHADNPVDWYPWGDEALARARREDKPILLSVGYSTCHWCHVMAHESFEDPAVAALLNAHFVCVKVDREERPDLDQIYQAALQMLTGKAGGWPLTMFLSPDQTPFFGGTYFPTRARFNLPGFSDVLRGVSVAYADKRHEIEEQNLSLRASLADGGAAAAGPVPAHGPVLARAMAQIKQNFDPVHGGYGGAPKFPRPAELEFLLRDGDEEARDQALFTLGKMAEGGLMDQLGGGFFRYSVDERWAIPHFEKMLYDNGPLLGLYADAWALTHAHQYARAAAGIVRWLEREMTDEEGCFYSALDADSEHEEGKFYVWTPAEAKALLSAREYAVVAAHWGLASTPNFEDQAWHLGVDRPLEEVAAELDLSVEEAMASLQGAADKLFAARGGRVRPGRDDKRLTAWNALMIKGLARAARRLHEPAWLAMAQRALDGLRRRVWRDGRLRANWMAGEARLNAYLDDHAFLLDALLELLQAEYRPADMDWALALADCLLARFEDASAGGFWFTSHDHEQLIHRAKPTYDNATPSGNGVAALALGRLGHLLGERRWLAAAERALAAQARILADHPQAAPTLLMALADYHHPPTTIVLRGGGTALAAWKHLTDESAPARTLVVCLPGEWSGLPAQLAKPASEDAVAHVCAGVNCLAPIVRLDDLASILRTPALL